MATCPRIATSVRINRSSFTVYVVSGAFSSANQLAWREARVALGAYAGQTIQLRWLYRSDGATNGQGWFVDDIALSRAMVPGPCATDAETLLVDGFE